MKKLMGILALILSAAILPSTTAMAHDPCHACMLFNNQPIPVGIGSEFSEFIGSRKVVVDINARDEEGRTALFLAARADNNAVVGQMLRSTIEPVVDPNIANENGRTPLMWAAIHRNTAMISVLLATRSSGNVALPDTPQGNKVALDFVFERESNNYYDAFIALVNGGADINEMEHENKDVLELFNATQTDPVSMTVFVDFYKALINAEGDVSAVAITTSQSALFAATKEGAEGLVRGLVDNGVDCNAPDPATAILPADYALEMRHESVLRYLRDEKNCLGGIVPCVINGIVEGFHCVCDTGYDAVGTGTELQCIEYPAVFRAFIANDTDLMEKIFADERAHEINPIIGTGYISGNHPPAYFSILQIASHPKMATLFADEPRSYYGTAGNGNGWTGTVLHELNLLRFWSLNSTRNQTSPFSWTQTVHMTRESSLDIMEYLLEQHTEIDIDATLDNGNTPLIVAAYAAYSSGSDNYIGHVSVLIDAEADCSIETTHSNGNVVSAWSYAWRAAAEGNVDFVDHMNRERDAGNCPRPSDDASDDASGSSAGAAGGASGASGAGGASGAVGGAAEPSGPRDVSELPEAEWQQFLEEQEREFQNLLNR